MKTIFASVLLFVVGVLVASAKSSVWKVSKGDSVLYLGGTVHMLRASDFPPPAEFETAYADSDKLVFEIAPSEMEKPEVMQKIMQAAVYTDGRTLSSVLSDESYAALEKAFSEYGMSIKLFETMKPGMAVMTLTVMALMDMGVTMEGVESFYEKKAKADDKAFGALETIDFQIGLIAAMGEGEEDSFISYNLKYLEETEQIYKEMIAEWKVGKSAKIEELLKLMQEFPDFYKDFIVDRNLAWEPQLRKMLKSPEKEYVLVGAAHLLGPDGLIEALRADGYTVTQLSAKK